MNNPYFFDDVLLPDGFHFPQSYLKLLSDDKVPNMHPWWLVATEPDKARMFFEHINQDRRSSKKLIPFAKIDDESGAIACFDGDDTSGNPKVYFAVGELSNVDWEKRYNLKDFDAWLLIVKSSSGKEN